MRIPGVLLALGGLVLLSSGARAQNAPPSSGAPPAGGGASPPPPRELPSTDYHHDAQAYARAKLPALRARWENPRIIAALRAYAPRYLPGCPLAAALAFGASSQGPAEDTGGDLSERGLFNVETSFIDRWANDDETRAVLGRAYNPSRASYASDLEAQVFTGMRRYRAALDSAAAATRYASGAPPVDAFGAWCAVTAYSVGAGTLAAIASRVAPGSDARRERPAALAAVVVQAARRGEASVAGVAMTGGAGAARAIVRPLQRYYAGRDLAAQVEATAAGWFDLAPVLSMDDDVRLSALAHG